jgi:glyoxylase-like metal-dependent hydrolase (beta-lactamase superfamily II)
MTEIIPGIYRIKLPITMENAGISNINAYLIKDTKGFLLVDSGWNTDDTLETLKKGMAEIGSDIDEISRIVITHIHPDHYGMAGRIKRLTGAEIMMFYAEKEFISPRYIVMDELLDQTDRMLIQNGSPKKDAKSMRDATLGLENYIVPTMPDTLLRDGDLINTDYFKLRVIWSPGHSSGHICLFEKDHKILLSGDHILPTITPNVSVHPQSIENPLGRYIESLKDIRKLDIELTLPGHNEPFKNLKGRIDEIIHHHYLRNLEILATIVMNGKTAYQIAQEITWGDHSKWKDLPPFHQRMAVFETMAHLEMMAAEYRVDKLPKRGIIYYRQRLQKVTK